MGVAVVQSRLPVLFTGFNRPDTSAQVLQAIREYGPSRLYVALDGARDGKAGEAVAVQSVRDLIEQMEWPCEVRRLYRSRNLGCQRAISEAISWFFEQEESGVILEDDCVPSIQYFTFAEGMLDYCRDDPNVFAIQGNCYSKENSEYSYYYSRLFFMWGWATWADRWRRIRLDQHFLAEVLEKGSLEDWPDRDVDVVAYWTNILRRQLEGEFDSWGYPTTFNLFSRHQVNVTPTVNLVRNIGHDSRATHSAGMNFGVLNEGFGTLQWPLRHCPKYYYPRTAARGERRWRIQIPRLFRLRQWVRRRFPRVITFLARIKARTKALRP